MQLIETQKQYWQLDAWHAAENHEPFYAVNLTPEQTEFLIALAARFRRQIIQSPNNQTIYFDPHSKKDVSFVHL